MKVLVTYFSPFSCNLFSVMSAFCFKRLTYDYVSQRRNSFQETPVASVIRSPL